MEDKTWLDLQIAQEKQHGLGVSQILRDMGVDPLLGPGRTLVRHDLGIEIAVLGSQPRQLLSELALVRSLHALMNAGKPPALSPCTIATYAPKRKPCRDLAQTWPRHGPDLPETLEQG